MTRLDDMIKQFEAEDPQGVAEAREWVRRVVESIKSGHSRLVIRDWTRWAEEARR